MRNKFEKGNKNQKLNEKIIKLCGLEEWSSNYKILKHFYHIDTLENSNSFRLQGYVYPEDFQTEDDMDINLPKSSIAYLDNKLILYFSNISYKKI